MYLYKIMIGTNLHKWLFSLTLLLSLVSFSGIAQEQVKSVNAITEVIYFNDVSPCAYYINLFKYSFAKQPVNYYGFNFNTFIQAQEELYFQKVKAQNVISFIRNEDFITIRLKQFSVIYTEDFSTLT